MNLRNYIAICRVQKTILENNRKSIRDLLTQTTLIIEITTIEGLNKESMKKKSKLI